MARVELNGQDLENVVGGAFNFRYNSKGKYYTDYIDIESFAKMYLMHEYVKSYDVCAGSILYHRDGQTDNDKLIAGPLWDLDNAMGSVYNNDLLGWQAQDRRSGAGDFIPNIFFIFLVMPLAKSLILSNIHCFTF